jgi:hypothetical protein
MYDEKNIESCHRYLIGVGLVGDDLIKKGCINNTFYERQSDTYKSEVESFLNRTKSINEIAVYTIYAYADFNIPRKYDILFDFDNVDDFVETSFTLEYSLINIAAYLYLNQTIEDGHKHVCILNFEKEVPMILRQLPDIKGFENIEKRICFCQKSDFEAIKDNLKNKPKREIY